jgi:siderophore synthetase component
VIELTPDADELSAHALLNCLVRELSGPAGQVHAGPADLWITLAHGGIRLHVGLRRRSRHGQHRFRGPVSIGCGGRPPHPVDAVGLAEVIGTELRLATGVANASLPAEVGASRDLLARFLRGARREDDPYLASEQALVRGHRFHPAPKARIGAAGDGLRYAPETGARFPLRFLAVRDGRLEQDAVTPADLARLDALAAGLPVPDGYRALPVHPWQWELTEGDPEVRKAGATGDLVDLGEHGPAVAATSSVRTTYHPALRAFLKFGLPVRITNCVRTLEPAHLASAVVLSRLLVPVLADLRRRHPATRLLNEPAQRHVTVGGTTYGVLLRDGPGPLPPGERALLAAAIADEYGDAPSRVAVLLGPGAPPARLLAWWQRYLELLVPPVLDAYFRHGLVLEAHGQNVIVVVDGDGMPTGMRLRDLEGAWLVADGPAERAATRSGQLPAHLREHLRHPPAQGWQRVAYCLFVNHLAELAAALADLAPALEPVLWARLHRLLRRYADGAGAVPPLRAVLAGAPLPAKANLTLRWRQAEDAFAEYVPWPNPMVPR